ncbi:hypothetical protein JHV675_51830 [Mycobacterium avium subsp. hominissuis]
MADITESARNPSRFMAMQGAFVDEHPARPRQLADDAHPLLCKSGALQRSPDYAPGEVLERCNQPLPANPGA